MTNPFTERILSSLEQNPETEKVGVARLLYLFTGLYERWHNGLEARRHPNGYHEPDYERILREREGQVEVRIEKYDEGGGRQSWQSWILTIVGSLIALGIGAVAFELADLKADMRASLARQEMEEKRIDRLEQRVYRGAP
jgi:hypothetical protein